MRMTTSAHPSTQKSLFWATGLMLFALFFGAGNLIFPAAMGQQAGDNIVSAMLGFMLTGAGLPLLGVAAIGYSGSRDVQELASRVTPLYGVLFAVLLYLSIGPLFAIPRTATVSFEIGIVPFLGAEAAAQKSWALAIFSLVFFAISYWLAMSPGKLIDRIGKVLTPMLLLCIAVLVGAAVLSPMGALQPAQAEFVTQPLVKGFLEGYNTMDALASLVFAIIVIDAIRARGVSDTKTLTGLTIRAGILAAVCLAVVYALIAYMGASSVSLFGILDTGAAVLSQTAQHYFGIGGNVLLAAIVFLACLTTSVGLITSCAEYFNRIWPRVSYRNFAIIFTLISCALANKGLAGIISFSIPMLMLLYPLTVVIILLAFLDKFFGGSRLVYVCTIFATLVVGLLDAYKTAFGFSEATAAAINNSLPLYNIGLGWLVPASAGFILGCILNVASKKKA
nr:branched-chain amino acid transport system II carrier protein [Uruburuella testudinis]